MRRFTAELVEQPITFSQLGNDLDPKLQRAYDFGQHLATALSKFSKELQDWQTSIAILQGVDLPLFEMADLQEFGQKVASHQGSMQFRELSPPICTNGFYLNGTQKQQSPRSSVSTVQTQLDSHDLRAAATGNGHAMPIGVHQGIENGRLRSCLHNASSQGLETSVVESRATASHATTSQKSVKLVTGEFSDQVRLGFPCQGLICEQGSSLVLPHVEQPQDSVFTDGSAEPREECKFAGAPSLKSTHSIPSNRDADPTLADLWTGRQEVSRRLPSADRVHQIESHSSGYYLNTSDLPWSFMNRFVIDPLSVPRYVLDSLGMTAVVYDIISFPLAAFDFDSVPFAQVCRMLTMAYWTLDFFVGFFSGYHLRTGQIEVRFWKTANNYLRHKAPIDFVIVATDWLLFVMQSSKAIASIARLTKVSRLMRVMRLLRLLRTAKLIELIEKMKSWPLSAALLSFLNVARLIINLAIINHFLACGWYAVGKGDSDEQETWVAKYLTPDDNMRLRYLISYHWAIAQFTPCPINIHPTNMSERVYTVVIIIFGLILFASLFGNVTAIINASRKNAYEAMMADHNLKEFLLINKVPLNLSTRIQCFLRLHRIRKTRVLEADVPRLATLTSTLRQELHYQVHGPPAKKHPFFDLMAARHLETFVHVCHVACRMDTSARFDEIFDYRGKYEGMLFPIKGTLEYLAGRVVRDVGVTWPYVSLQMDVKTIIDAKREPGGWINEQPMWLADWENRGLLTVSEQSDLVIIESAKFREVAAVHSSSLYLSKRYARLFADTMSQDARAKMSIDDLWGSRYRECAMSDRLSSVEVLTEALNEFTYEVEEQEENVTLRRTPRNTRSLIFCDS